jgi:phage-related minor tail protein
MGFSRITKRVFYSLFKVAWLQAMTKENIKSAFKKPGIEPLDAPVVLDQIRPNTPPNPTQSEEGILTIRRLRKATKMLRTAQEDQHNQVQQLIVTSEKLVIRNEILEHEIRMLRATLIDEKRRRKRGKKMGLIDLDNPGQAQFFSLERIAKARADIAIAKAETARGEAAAIEKKIQAGLEKQRKEIETLRKREEREKRIASNKAATAKKRQDTQEAREARQVEKQL